MKWWHWGLIGFAAVSVVAGINRSSQPENKSSYVQRAVPEPDTRENPQHKVSVEATWPSGKGRFNVGRFTLKNTNSFAVKDIAYLCELKAQSGTVVQTVRDTLFEIIPAGESVTTPLINFGEIHGQARTAECVARRAQVA